MTNQDHSSEWLDERFVIVDNVGRFDTKGRIAVTRTELAAIQAELAKAQTNGVAWSIKLIDQLHIGTRDSNTTDRLFKGLKNSIRDSYKAEIGIDPAPSYPVNVKLIKEVSGGTKNS